MIIFESILSTFEASVIFEAAGAVLKISWSLQVTDCNQVKLAQIRETHCTTDDHAHNNPWYNQQTWKHFLVPMIGLLPKLGVSNSKWIRGRKRLK